MRFIFSRLSILMAALIFTQTVIASPNPVKWKALIHRTDGRAIVFNFNWLSNTTIAFTNGKEALTTTDIQKEGDSTIVRMPVFESYFKFKNISSDSISGFWIRELPSSEQRLPFTATISSQRFAQKQKPNVNANGKWAINFGNNADKPDPAIAEFVQKGSLVTGSILTPTGDYRFLEGTIAGDSLWLSTFDGVHALVLSGKINPADQSISGQLWSGARSLEDFSGKKALNPTLPNTAAMDVAKGESPYLDFAFQDIEGNKVSIKDDRFKGKVVIIDLMGSWCPNCMDETVFLSDFYKKNKSRGIEVVSLAYEYTTDLERSKKSLDKFRKKFDVTYPMLITGVAVGDPLRTEKTLPQLTPIKMFPSTIVLDKTGKVAFIDTGFQGPGTGDYYKEFVKEFNQKINQLL